jgi:hypothetical protein
MVGTLQRSIPADQPSCVIERPACGSQIASLEFLYTTTETSEIDSATRVRSLSVQLS